MFGGYCFDRVMADDTHYRKCKNRCLANCQETAYIVFLSYSPLNLDQTCRQPSFHHQHFKHSFHKHFAFHNYKTLVEGGSIPDLLSSYANGSLCRNYVQNYVSFVRVESPQSRIILTKRDKSFYFHHVFGTIGGTFGLLTGVSMISFGEIVFLLIGIRYHSRFFEQVGHETTCASSGFSHFPLSSHRQTYQNSE